MCAAKRNKTFGKNRPSLKDLPNEPPFFKFTRFEAQALAVIAQFFGVQEESFLQQVSCAKVLHRINTIAGFYTDVMVDRTKCQPINFEHRGALFNVENVENGVGVVLWDRDGYLELIEGYTIGDSQLENLKLSDLSYISLEAPT